MKTKFFLLLPWLAVPLVAAAQPAHQSLATNALPLTPALINEWAEELRTNHPALLSARAQTEAAAAGVAAVRTWEDPVIQLGGVSARKDFRASDGDIFYGVEQKLPLFGKPRLARQIAAAGFAVETNNVDFQFQNLRREFSQALFQAALANETVAVGEEDLVWLAAMTQTLESKYQTGQSRLAEVLSLQNQQAKRGEQLVTDRKKLVHHQVGLNRFLNRSFHSPWPKLELPGVADAVEYNDALIARAVAHEPKLKMMRAQIQQAEATVALTRRQRLPEVSAGFQSRNYSGNGNFRQAEFMVSFNLPWGNAAKYRSDIRRDEAKRTAAAFDVADYELSVRENLHLMTVNLDAARRTARLYRDEILPRSAQAVAAARTAWETGGGQFRDVLDARRMLLDARLAYAMAVAEQQQMLGELAFVCGNDAVNFQTK